MEGVAGVRGRRMRGDGWDEDVPGSDGVCTQLRCNHEQQCLHQDRPMRMQPLQRRRRQSGGVTAMMYGGMTSACARTKRPAVPMGSTDAVRSYACAPSERTTSAARVPSAKLLCCAIGTGRPPTILLTALQHRGW